MNWHMYFSNRRIFGDQAIAHPETDREAIIRLFKRYRIQWHPDKVHDPTAKAKATANFQKLSGFHDDAMRYFENREANAGTGNADAARAYSVMTRLGFLYAHPRLSFESMPVVTPQLARHLTSLLHARLAAPIVAANGDLKRAWAPYPLVLEAYLEWKRTNPSPTVHWPDACSGQRWAPAVEFVARCVMADLYGTSLRNRLESIGMPTFRKMLTETHRTRFDRHGDFHLVGRHVPFGEEMWKMLS